MQNVEDLEHVLEYNGGRLEQPKSTLDGKRESQKKESTDDLTNPFKNSGLGADGDLPTKSTRYIQHKTPKVERSHGRAMDQKDF